ncbi:MAG: hypothetical protein BWX86_00229 [Verrucomicrobia bacterium ADurb.Bin122]|nr:MAG: hypothetical protein BWX86_00229 [Verrucomicrobia bacterium ADurb.Bin122]
MGEARGEAGGGEIGEDRAVEAAEQAVGAGEEAEPFDDEGELRVEEPKLCGAAEGGGGRAVEWDLAEQELADGALAERERGAQVGETGFAVLQEVAGDAVGGVGGEGGGVDQRQVGGGDAGELGVLADGLGVVGVAEEFAELGPVEAFGEGEKVEVEGFELAEGFVARGVVGECADLALEGR